MGRASERDCVAACLAAVSCCRCCHCSQSGSCRTLALHAECLHSQLTWGRTTTVGLERKQPCWQQQQQQCVPRAVPPAGEPLSAAGRQGAH